MKTLFLLRHAKASKDDPSLPDIKRPLTERGFGDARLVSEMLRHQELIPEKIVSSTAVRACTTAYLFAATFEKVENEIELLPSLYNTGEEEYLEVISAFDDSYSSCMLAGHNDTITETAERLLGKTIEPMKTCGVIIISSEAKTWKEFVSSECKLVLNLYPSLLK